MSLFLLLLIAIAVYLLLQYLFVRKIDPKKGTDLQKIGKSGSVAALKVVRDGALVASITYASLAILIWLYGHMFGGSADFFIALEDFGSWVSNGLSAAKDYVKTSSFVVALVGFAWLTFDRYRLHILRVFRNIYDQTLLTVHAEPETDLAEPATVAVLRGQLEQARAELTKVDAEESPSLQTRQTLLQRIKSLEDQVAAEWQRVRMEKEAAVAAQEKSEKEALAWASLNWFQRSVLVLGSKGLFNDLKLGGKVLGYATQSTLALALVGIASPGATRDILNHTLHLDDLRVEAMKTAVKRNLPAVDASLQEPTKADVSAARQLRAQINRAILENPSWRSSHRAAAASSVEQQLVSDATSQSVLSEVHVPAVDEAGGATIPKAAEKTFQNTEHATAQDREIIGWMGHKWGEVRASVLKHAALYGEPLDYSDVRSALIDKVVSQAFAEAPKAPDEVSNLFRDTLKAELKDSVKTAMDIEFKRAVIDLGKGKPLDEVLTETRTRRVSLPERYAIQLDEMIQRASRDRFAEEFHRNGGIRTPSDPNANASAANQAAQTVAEDLNAEGNLNQDNLAAMDDYDQTFPRAAHETPVDADAKKKEASILPADLNHDHGGNPGGSGGGFSGSSGGGSSGGAPSEGGGSGVGSGFDVPKSPSGGSGSVLASAEDVIAHNGGASAAVSEIAQGAEFAVARAHSFEMLRGFSRVGGVLIGRDPDPLTKLNFIDLRWEFQDDTITLTLIRSDNRTFSLGPYPKQLVHQALAYASDGRPLAVTMMDAAPLVELKILLHPALLDTALGHQVIDMDRWVDTYARSEDEKNQELRDSEVLIDTQSQIYGLAWAERSSKAIALLKYNSSQDQNVIRRWNARVENISSRAASLKDSDLAAVRLDDPKLSILFAKPEFFDPALVKVIHNCSIETTIKSFRTCVGTEADSVLSDKSKTDLSEWNAPPPRFQHWSGVREKAFHLDSDLQFLHAPAQDNHKDLWPFEFMLQAAFTTPPVFAQAGGQSSVFVDKQPFEFPTMKENIATHVHAALQKGGAMREHFEVVRQFAILQRLFRTAIAGDFGANFPLSRLPVLAHMTSAGGIQRCPTPRWNPRPGGLENTLGRVLMQAEDSAKAASDASTALTTFQRRGNYCLIRMVAWGDRLDQVPTAEWDQACNLGDLAPALTAGCSESSRDACDSAKEAAQFSSNISHDRTLRRALNVDLAIRASRQSCANHLQFTASR